MEVRGEYSKAISKAFGISNIYLFALRLNKQVKQFCSWKPDSEADYFDAFFNKLGRARAALHLSPILPDLQMSSEDASRAGERVAGGTIKGLPAMYGGLTHNVSQRTSVHNKEERAYTAIVNRGTPNHEVHHIDGMSSIRKKQREWGISAAGTDIILADGIDPHNLSVSDIIMFFI